MAHKKAGGSTRNGRDSESKRLGVKRFGGQHRADATAMGTMLAPVAIASRAAPVL